MKIILNLSTIKKEEFDLPEEKARKIKKDWEDKNIPSNQIFVITDDFSIPKSAIRNGIKLISDFKNNDDYNKNEKEWKDYKAKIKALPPEERWKHDSLERFKLFFKLYKDREPSEKAIEVFKAHSIKFFKENPDCFCVSPKVFLDCLGKGFNDFCNEFSSNNPVYRSGFNKIGNIAKQVMLKNLSQLDIY